jgi:hypothetical protein
VTGISRIKTSHIFPPIPIRDFDLVAWIDGEEEGLRGHGKTESDAVIELQSLQAELDESNPSRSPAQDKEQK